MTKTIMTDEYRNHDGLQTLVLTIEEERTKPEIGQMIANLWFQYASIESQLIRNPGSADLISQRDKIVNDIEIYTNYFNGFDAEKG